MSLRVFLAPRRWLVVLLALAIGAAIFLAPPVDAHTCGYTLVSQPKLTGQTISIHTHVDCSGQNAYDKLTAQLWKVVVGGPDDFWDKTVDTPPALHSGFLYSSWVSDCEDPGQWNSYVNKSYFDSGAHGADADNYSGQLKPCG